VWGGGRCPQGTDRRGGGLSYGVGTMPGIT